MTQKMNKEISNVELEFGIWYTSHKIFLKKIFLFIFIAFNILLYSYNIYTSFQLFVAQRDRNSNLLLNMLYNSPGVNSVKQKLKPADIQINGITILHNENNTVNIVAEVFNPNNIYYANRIMYRFSDSQKIFSEGETYLWPQERRYIIIYNIPAIHSSQGVNVQLYRVIWKRMNDYIAKQQERMNFPIQMAGFTPSQVVFGDTFIPGSIKFTIENQTIFNYWDVELSIVLYNGTSIVGSAYTQLHTLKSLEKISLDIKILTDASAVTNVEIFPEINILDDAVYLKNEEIIGEPK